MQRTDQMRKLPAAELARQRKDTATARKRTDAIRPVVTNLKLLNLAKAKVEQKLAAHPNDARTLRQMGDLQRKLGDFGAASETYRKLKAVDDDAVAAWWIGALNGEQLPASVPEEPHPTPFIRITNFLTAAQRDVLFGAVRQGREHFVPAQTANTAGAGINLDTRAALVAERSVKRQIRPWFVQALARVMDDVARHFRVCGMDRVDGLDREKVELSVTAHHHGDFFRVHQDIGPGADSRLVSFAYYFHREPKDFSGGDLLLYDTCIAAGDCRLAAFSRIEPTNNSLVFFPSAYYHEVLPVLAKGDAFGNARFTVNGWLHRAGI